MSSPSASSDPTRTQLALEHVRILALAGATAIAFSSTLVRLSKASPSTAAIFRCAYALPLLAFLAHGENRRYGSRSWRERRWALLSGVFFAADLILWHNSIRDVGAGLATVLANGQVVMLPLLAWMLRGEHPGGRLFAALPVALAGVLLISGVVGHHAYGRNPTAGALFGLGAGVAYAGFLFLLREGGSDLRRTAGQLFDSTAVATLTAAAAGVVIGDARFVPVWPGAGWLILLAFSSQVLGWLLIARSLPRAPAALVALLLTFQPIGSVAIAALVLGESPARCNCSALRSFSLRSSPRRSGGPRQRRQSPSSRRRDDVATVAEAIESFPCFGGAVTVIVDGPGPGGSPEAAAAAVKRRMLEWNDQFSRFDPDSELSRVNADPRETVPVSPVMGRFVDALLSAAAASGGLVDARRRRDRGGRLQRPLRW